MTSQEVQLYELCTAEQRKHREPLRLGGDSRRAKSSSADARSSSPTILLRPGYQADLCFFAASLHRGRGPRCRLLDLPRLACLDAWPHGPSLATWLSATTFCRQAQWHSGGRRRQELAVDGPREGEGREAESERERERERDK